MSNYESSDDGMDELEELMQEYRTEEDKLKKPSTDENSGVVKKEKSENDEISMEKVLFGNKDTLIKNLSKVVNKKRQESENSGYESDDSIATNERKRKPAWEDDDDDDLTLGEVKRPTRHTGPLDHLPKDKSYKDYLTSKYTRIVNQPKWASLNKKTKVDKDAEASSDSDEELLKSVGFLDKTSKGQTLRKSSLQFKTLKDLNRASYAEGSITGIQFHPTSTAALVCGAKGLATIYSIDGFKNEKLHSMRFDKFPMKCAKITPCGKRAIFGSVRKFYYSYDLISAQETKLILPPDIKSFHRFEISPCGRYIAAVGKFGMVHLLTASTNELIHTFKQEETAENVCFTGDSLRLICNANSSNVNIFSIRQLRMEHKFVDDGCIKGSVLDVSPNQRLLATGSMEGVVNIYDFDKVLQSSMPLPEKNFMNLRTAISHVRFNHSSEILAMCSDLVPNAVKMAHISSATVFANFPDSQAKLGNIQTIEFSPASGFMALGSKASKVPLFRLKHFKNY